MTERITVLKVDFEHTSHLTEIVLQHPKEKILHIFRGYARIIKQERKLRKELPNPVSNEEKTFSLKE